MFAKHILLSAETAQLTTPKAFQRPRLCLETRSGFERLIFHLTASPPEADIDDKTNIACFAVFVREKRGFDCSDGLPMVAFVLIARV